MPSFMPPPVRPPRYAEKRRPAIIFSMGSTGRTSEALRNEAIKIRSTSEHSNAVANYVAFASVFDDLQMVSGTASGWNEYGSPAPTNGAVSAARRIATSLAFTKLKPERVQPSADGGISFTYVGTGANRAMIEAGNDGEHLLLLYDMDGNTSVSTWDLEMPEQAMLRLEEHIGGKALAKDRY